MVCINQCNNFALTPNTSSVESCFVLKFWVFLGNCAVREYCSVFSFFFLCVIYSW